MPVISVILPTFNEEDNLEELYGRLVTTIDSISYCNFEIIFVDDCSTDKTTHILKQLRKNDARVYYLRFSRNCGSHAAVAAGLKFCRGDAAVIMAADLQDPPELLNSLIKEWQAGYKVVWGVREKREGERKTTLAFSRFYYFLMNKLSDIKQPPTGADVFLVDRQSIDAFKDAPEKNTSITMLVAWLGFPQTSIDYKKEARFAGVSKWTTSKRFKLFFDSLVSFSYVPLRFMSFMGTIAAFFGVLFSLFTLIRALKGIPVEGWASLMIVVLFIGGFQMIMMGMLGEYLWRTYDETRGRPRYVIEKNTLLDDKSKCSKDRNDENSIR